jgi:hypothetical protein
MNFLLATLVTRVLVMAGLEGDVERGCRYQHVSTDSGWQGGLLCASRDDRASAGWDSSAMDSTGSSKVRPGDCFPDNRGIDSMAGFAGPKLTGKGRADDECHRQPSHKGNKESATMRTRIDYIATLLAVGAAAVALATAPSASAVPDDQTCSDMGGATRCQRTVNAQIYAKPHALPTAPNSTYGPFLGYHNGRT